MSNVSSPSNLAEIFQRRVSDSGTEVALQWLEHGQLRSLTWSAWWEASQCRAAALVARGIEPGDRVAILAENSVEWPLFELAIVMAGAITVPIFPAERAQTCAEQLKHSGARVVVAQGVGQLEKLLSMRSEIVDVSYVVVLPEVDGVGALAAQARLSEMCAAGPTWLQSLQDFTERGRECVPDLKATLAERVSALRPEGCATIAYSPGTEGRWKGSVLTHGNICAAVTSLAAVMPVDHHDRQLVYLPLAQVFARVTVQVAVFVGFTTILARSHRTVFEDCSVAHPTFLCGVPRLFDKLRTRLRSELRAQGAFSRLLLEVDEGASDEEEGLLPTLRRKMTTRLLSRRIKHLFGGGLRFAVSGGAPLGSDVAEFFGANGLQLLEGYGMTETCAAGSINLLDDNTPGTCGHALPSVAMRLASDGELLLRGPMITPHYWGRPDVSACDDAGWFHTGDLGRFDREGRLVITGRKRDVIVTGHGKAISPQPIEDTVRSTSQMIAQVLVHGDRRRFLSALIALDQEALAEFAKEHGLAGDYELLARHPRVFEAIEHAVERANTKLSHHEQVRKFAILSQAPSAANGELTVTQSLRRSVAEKHRGLLDSFYQEQY